MAFVWTNLRDTSRGKFSGDGLQYRHSVRHAAVRHPKHSLFQVAHEQGPRLHHVRAVLHLRSGIPHVRVRDPRLPRVMLLPSARVYCAAYVN